MSLSINRYYVFAVGLLVLIGAVAYGAFYAPVLYADDLPWFIGAKLRGTLDAFDWRAGRPLQDLFPAVQYSMAGTNLNLSYAVTWLLSVAAGILFYHLVYRLSKERLLAFLAAALMMVYPADFTHMCISALTIRFSLVCALGMGVLLYHPEGECPSRAAVLAVFALWLFSLLTYEAHWGLVMAGAGLMLLQNWRRKAHVGAVIGVLFTGVLFLAWKWFHLRYIAVDEPRVNAFVFNLPVLIQRIASVPVTLVRAWLDPLALWIGCRVWMAGLLLLGSVVLAGQIFVWISGRWGRQLSPMESRGLSLKILFVVGLLLMLAGYWPIIMVHAPQLHGVKSRVNGFAMPGMALMCVVVLAAFSNGIWRARARAGLTGMLGVLLLEGIIVQAAVQYDAREAWNHQKAVWRQMFDTVPALTDGTKVFLEMPADTFSVSRYSWTRGVFSASQEVSEGIRVFYNNVSLNGSLAFVPAERQYWRFEPEGIWDGWTGGICPYDKAIVLRYDEQGSRINIVMELADRGVVTTSYKPAERIRPEKPVLEARRLVEN